MMSFGATDLMPHDFPITSIDDGTVYPLNASCAFCKKDKTAKEKLLKCSACKLTHYWCVFWTLRLGVLGPRSFKMDFTAGLRARRSVGRSKKKKEYYVLNDALSERRIGLVISSVASG